jgi:uncharacterized protein (TIGR03437 family)
MSERFLHHFNPLGMRCFISVLAAALMICFWPQNTLAQATCQAPSVPYSYEVSGRVTDETGKPLEGVGIYVGLQRTVTDPDGSWRRTITGCTLSPPRCGTGFNFRFAPVRPGFFFTPSTGEICPGSVVNFVARAASFTSVSAASFRDGLAPGAIATAFAAAGSSLASGTESATSLPLPESLAGTTVTITTISGFVVSSKKAQLYYVGPNQVNYYLPSDLGEGPGEISIATANGLTLKSSALITKIAPAVFAANSNGQGVAAAVALRVKADGSQQYEPVAQFDQAQNRFVPSPIDLSAPDDQVFLILFGTGFRSRSSLESVAATIGGVNSQVSFAGPQGSLVGLDQANLRLDRALAGRGEMDVVLAVDGQFTNAVRIEVK